ncbi:hypothetical protein [Amycolatopsis sp. NPDC102389]|uniref:hypothetical protein n=1 Tax=Amycolatopsis sp. NPDC102389 TaxID=3363941 RepID=UPI0037F634AC
MVEVHDGPPMDGFSVPLRLHNLLLALAGRIDDSALTEARELIARAHIDEAVELTTGTLIAGKIPVSSSEQRELALVLEMSRSDATLANDLLVVEEDEPVLTHRFTGENQPEFGLAEALDRTLQVLPDVRSVHAVWRNTPAGSVPGALPQRVVLVEIGPEGNPPAVAFRVDTALRRAGIRSVVEVAGPGVARSAYHQAASSAASPVWVTGSTHSSDFRSEPVTPPPAPAPAPEPVKEQPSRHGLRPVSSSTHEPVEPIAPVVPIVQAPATASSPAASTVSSSESAPPRKSRAETRAERTADLTPAEVAQLRQALKEDPEKGREIATGKPSMHEVVELPALDLDDPSLSERDRALLRELHAELAERERAEAAKIRLNGASRSSGSSWS